MNTYSRFSFDSYELDAQRRKILLHYSFDDDIHFTETITLPPHIPLHNANSPDVQRALFALHLAGGISYFKAFCPPSIAVKSGHLNTQQADFWRIFYTKGLGEFFYTNNIDFTNLIQFPISSHATQQLTPAAYTQPTNALIPFGGGKDSQMTVELLKKQQMRKTLFRMQPHHFITKLAHSNSLPLLEVQRELDPQLFELNQNGALNGHVPVTGYVTFLTIVVALLNGFDSVFFSNERSSDYGNVPYLGIEVNHQWSKSNEAERLMRAYIEQFVTHNVRYYNMLRPLSDLHIARLFTERALPFLPHITSCNRNWLWKKLDAHTDAPRWCGECEKCAFTFAIFAAYVPLKQLETVFGKNLFDDPSLINHYRRLWGQELFKPFECVGTPEETQAALYKATQSADYAATVIGTAFLTDILPQLSNPDALVRQALTPDFTEVPAFVTEIIQNEVSHENSRA